MSSDPTAAKLHQPSAGSERSPEIELLESLPCTLEVYQGRDTVFEVGDSATYLFHIVQGMVFTSRSNEQGDRRVLRLYFPGDIVGLETLSCSTYDADLVAGAEAVLAVYQKRDFGRALQQSTRACNLVIAILSRENEALLDHLERVTSHSARQRLARLMLTIDKGLNGHLKVANHPNTPRTIMIPQKVLADTLGISHVHLSRLMTLFKQESLIRSGREIELLDRPALEKLGFPESGA